MTEFQVVTEKRNNIIILSLQKIKNILKIHTDESYDLFLSFWEH